METNDMWKIAAIIILAYFATMVNACQFCNKENLKKVDNKYLLIQILIASVIMLVLAEAFYDNKEGVAQFLTIVIITSSMLLPNILSCLYCNDSSTPYRRDSRHLNVQLIGLGTMIFFMSIVFFIFVEKKPKTQCFDMEDEWGFFRRMWEGIKCVFIRIVEFFTKAPWTPILISGSGVALVAAGIFGLVNS